MRTARLIQVLVADDSEIVRHGLCRVLESADDVHVVAEAWDGQSAVEAAGRFSPDVALVDIHMPGVDGLAATRALRSLPVPPRVLILTTFARDEYVDEAVLAGASGYLLKDTPALDLLAAVRHVAAGRASLDPTVTARVMEQLATRGSAQLTRDERVVMDSLTVREVELLRLIGLGLSNARIGETLYLTEGTVKGQVSRLLAKIGAENRVQAARLAYRAGLET
ncbi:response regulator [Streptomyces sp. IBSNAI002]|uniref:response regulator n=1 Tax=Streptomyces sp. IBSNAI002 TaxID=3457500 RepID=UPI003FCF0B95